MQHLIFSKHNPLYSNTDETKILVDTMNSFLNIQNYNSSDDPDNICVKPSVAHSDDFTITSPDKN